MARTLFLKSGQKFGMLTLVNLTRNKGREAWFCQCDCGNSHAVPACTLVSGNTTSCGCKRNARIGNLNRTHSMARTPEYSAWNRMKRRCQNESCPDYPQYGARGITVCDEWINSFEAFYAHVGPKPKGYSIDRIDNSKGYCHGNVRWATPLEQARNTRSNKYITAFGRTQCLAKWAAESGLCAETIAHRMGRGLSPEVAISRRPYDL